jgi:hypothetical protein
MSNYNDNVIRYSEGSSSLYAADQAVQQLVGGGSVGNEAILTSGAFGAGGGGASSYSVTTSTSYGSGAGGASYAASSGAGGALYGNSAQYSGGFSSGAVGGALSSVGSASSGQYLSEIEASILRSTVPISVNETEEISVLGERGIWANRLEVANWRGAYPISQYVINEDSSPEIITKKTQEQLTYIQELAIRYLRPPTPPAPGEIVITQEANTATAPAPPIILRQAPPRPPTPEPLVLREAPPQPPAQVGRKVITISGKRLPPPPRKVVIERLAPLPSKPQSVIVERWLPYGQVKRRVIFQRSTGADPVVVKPRNVVGN